MVSSIEFISWGLTPDGLYLPQIPHMNSLDLDRGYRNLVRILLRNGGRQKVIGWHQQIVIQECLDARTACWQQPFMLMDCVNHLVALEEIQYFIIRIEFID